MEETQPVAAAILAGGQARRLGGANKASIEIDGARIFDRQYALLHQITSTLFVVGGSTGPWLARGVRLVADEIPGAGALGGIYTALGASPYDRTLVIGCDMPFLSAPFLRRMLSVDDADLVIPRSRRGYEPLCAVYRKACMPGILDRISRGVLEASTLPHGVRVAEISPAEIAAYDPDDRLFVNINTPHDYARATRLIETMRQPIEDRITTDTDS